MFQKARQKGRNPDDINEDSFMEKKIDWESSKVSEVYWTEINQMMCIG